MCVGGGGVAVCGARGAKQKDASRFADALERHPGAEPDTNRFAHALKRHLGTDLR